ncbi:MAG: HpcH/HpaI aldolase/citrate lyase family protein [Geminicoccaceae bacterium]
MPFRSILFTPATRLDRLEKALASGADWVALDLEDGVGPGDKTAARQALAEFAETRMAANADRIAVRINRLSLPDGIRDMARMLDWPVWPGLLILPKVESAAEVAQLIALTASLGRSPVILITLESALGLAEASKIAASAPKEAVLAYGSADHLAETGGMMSEPSLAFGRAQVVNAAALAGIPALDGVWLDFKSPAGLIAEAELVKSMGFSGKIAIHPDQVGPINRVFSPSDEEIAAAAALLEASKAAGGGAFAFKGKMVDAPVLARARRLIEIDGRVE